MANVPEWMVALADWVGRPMLAWLAFGSAVVLIGGLIIERVFKPDAPWLWLLLLVAALALGLSIFGLIVASPK